MKMKKLFLLFSMITVLFSLTACSNGQESVDFEYDDNDIVFSSVAWADTFQNIDEKNRAYIENEGTEAYKSGLSNFDTTKKECGEFLGYRAQDAEGVEDTDSNITIDIAALNTDENANAKVLDFLDKLYSEVEEDGKNVIVTLKAVYEQRVVELRFVYEKDPSSVYNESAAPYKLAEVTTTPEYTTGEKMSKAASNTLMGMATVFGVLIFISLIIAQFERVTKVIVKIGNLFNKSSQEKAENENKESKEEVQRVSAVAPVTSVSADPMEDTQLVAVITAAVVAANVASGGSDKLIVRSIKKAKRI